MWLHKQHHNTENSDFCLSEQLKFTLFIKINLQKTTIFCHIHYDKSTADRSAKYGSPVNNAMPNDPETN